MFKSRQASRQAVSAEENAWSPLAEPVFRALWIASAVSNVGGWMQSTATAWLMATIAPSAVMVSLVQTATSLPVFLLALPSGALADVVDRRRVILFTQLWMLVSAAALGVITMMGQTTPWVLLLLVLALGVGTAVNAPAWQAIVPELVPRAQMPSAVALNSAGFNLARAVGPALGGLALVAVGPGPTFLINAASFLGVILVLVFWKRPPRESVLPAERFLGAMRTGIRYVRYSKSLQAVFIRASVFIVCASAQMALLPLLARDQLGSGSAGYGLLLGAFGVGGVAGALILPKVRRRLSLDALAAAATLIFAASLSVSGLVHDFAVVSMAMFLAGMCWLGLLASFNSSVQAAAPAWVRGRCLAVYMLIFFGGMAGGSLLWGAAASAVGIPNAFHLAALGLMVGLAGTFRFELAGAGQMDLTPSAHWSTPSLVMEPNHEDGPVLVTVQYNIDPQKHREFGLAMRRQRRARLRGGAFRWALFKDIADPGRYVESFIVESWLEHLRQHERVTVVDREIEADVRAFQTGKEGPVVSHYLATTLPKGG